MRQPNHLGIAMTKAGIRGKEYVSDQATVGTKTARTYRSPALLRRRRSRYNQCELASIKGCRFPQAGEWRSEQRPLTLSITRIPALALSASWTKNELMWMPSIGWRGQSAPTPGEKCSQKRQISTCEGRCYSTPDWVRRRAQRINFSHAREQYNLNSSNSSIIDPSYA